MISLRHTRNALATLAIALSMLTIDTPAGAAASTNRADGGSFAPESGWYYSPSEPGGGYSIEVSGSNVFMAAYLYRSNGTSVWYVGSGQLTGNTFTAPFYEYQGGEALGGAYSAASVIGAAATGTVTFTTATAATLSWGDAMATTSSTTEITRFPLDGASVAAPSLSPVPQTGWYWNASEPGTGYFAELQGGTMLLAAYTYDTDGTARWYAARGTPLSWGGSLFFAADLLEYANGQTLSGAFQSPSFLANKGQIFVQFTSTTDATITLPGGRQLTIAHYAF